MSVDTRQCEAVQPLGSVPEVGVSLMFKHVGMAVGPLGANCMRWDHQVCLAEGGGAARSRQ
eukprot:8721085-Lingulodinium_polyedra.AAC.1